MGYKIKVWGDYALFSRPEMKVERYSYDVMTPSAARGILDALYWHPGMKWIVDRIYVQKPIQFISIRRNGIRDKVSASKALSVYNGSKKELSLNTQGKTDRRTSLILKDVQYIIEAHFEMTQYANENDSKEKFSAIINRRLERGQCYHQPYFGCREFPAHFCPCEDGKITTAYEDEENHDLGFMFYGMSYTSKDIESRDQKAPWRSFEEICPTFFRANMKHGVLDLRNVEVYQ